MALDKAVAYGKENREPYRKSAQFDRSCRHGGDCPWCHGNRTIGNRRIEPLRDALRDTGEDDS